ncbi:MAG: 1-deoxy-D-xylulose-5-phosphate synthase N-terminal domain-containing protein, partial [Spirochaetota bacterium]|nr:1-deoxy-D-xylulose-5-phosphate synthase N-terminal domain-containing protein [Spirochaetota bacterium]
MEQKPLLNRINSPDKLKELPLASLPDLALEIRERIIEVVGNNGGHMASNLGVVELTIAMHRVFNSPVDQFV